MESIAIFEFKATCLSVLEKVRRTGQPILVTRRGEPVAEIVPPARPSATRDWIGSAVGSGRIVGELVAPAADPSEWTAFRQ